MSHHTGAVAWNDEIEICADSLYLELTGKSAEPRLSQPPPPPVG